MTTETTSLRGFARLTAERRREIAASGGRAVHEMGLGYEFSSEAAREAGKKGGEATSQDKEHMREIGKKGGEKVSRDREHMREIGRKGGRGRHAQDGR